MKVEFIFHGTGTSSCIPNIACLTAPPDEPKCMTCWLAHNPGQDGRDPEEDLKNRRRNTGAIIRVTKDDGTEVVIVIDVGKSFINAAIDLFPKYNLRRIDAIVLTHPHADASNGLDDLRCWTLKGAIQSHIDIYLNQRTFVEVQRTFPYLVDKGMATGGGDVPDFQWHIISEFVEFEIQGIKITPLLLYHGRYFESQSAAPSPQATRPATPMLPSTPLLRTVSSSATPSLSKIPSTISPPQALYPPSPKPQPTSVPYPSLGFLLPNFLYLSDVSEIPQQTLEFITTLPPESKPDVAIIDCLRPATFTSHFGLEQAVTAARLIDAQRTYLIGFTCGGPNWISHRGWVRILEAVSTGADVHAFDEWESSEKQRSVEALAMVPRGEGTWVRPSFDGLRIIAEEGRITDGVYD